MPAMCCGDRLNTQPLGDIQSVSIARQIYRIRRSHPPRILALSSCPITEHDLAKSLTVPFTNTCNQSAFFDPLFFLQFVDARQSRRCRLWVSSSQTKSILTNVPFRVHSGLSGMTHPVGQEWLGSQLERTLLTTTDQANMETANIHPLTRIAHGLATINGSAAKANTYKISSG